MAGFRRPDRWRIDMTEQEQLRQLKEEYENMTIPEAGRERLQAGIDRARMEKKRAERDRRRSTVPFDRRICFLPDQAHEPWSDFIVSRHLVYGIRFYVWQRVWIRGYLKTRVDASDG